ncbi:MAG: DUF1351 domain-containing protein [Spirochaetales bacterium]|nr:DUF1351 domain-containing protein [Spirochaetales bacterium]
MNEITVKVEQSVGSISWNYDEIKNRLMTELETYKNTAYTDDTIKDAKTDLASLRKLSKDINARKVEIKNKCLEPYAKIEAEAQELIALVDEPINAINDQVKDYEERRKNAVKAKIEEFWNKESEKLPDRFRLKTFQITYDTKWLNATTTMKTWKDAITNKIEAVNNDLKAITDFHSDYEEDMFKAYEERMQLADAIQKMRSLEAERERILEMERRKKEAEEARRRAEEERRLAEEKRLAEEAARKEEEDAKNIQTEDPHDEAGHDDAAEQTAPPAENETPAQITPEPQEEHEEVRGLGTVGTPKMEAPAAATVSTEGSHITLKISGTPEQLKKIRAYIEYVGAECSEVSI